MQRTESTVRTKQNGRGRGTSRRAVIETKKENVEEKNIATCKVFV